MNKKITNFWADQGQKALALSIIQLQSEGGLDMAAKHIDKAENDFPGFKRKLADYKILLKKSM